MRCNHSIEVDPDICTSCNFCVEACPVDCLTMVTADRREFSSSEELSEGEKGSAVIRRDEFCIRCSICINVCPENCIYFKRLSLPS